MQARSNTDMNHTLSKQRIADYTKSTSHSNMHHIHNNGTSAETSKAYHRNKMAQALAHFDKQFRSQPPS
ncbi:hypothetical protein CABS01_11672 [Colletotrichum abscissum]|nr:uncharacterized protein CABS01_11672 [Colletotrichum abscissum]KAK1493503.1 hypothetical protein CABS01_11672 [Colletotrichum abscissum]